MPNFYFVINLLRKKTFTLNQFGFSQIHLQIIARNFKFFGKDEVP